MSDANIESILDKKSAKPFHEGEELIEIEPARRRDNKNSPITFRYGGIEWDNIEPRSNYFKKGIELRTNQETKTLRAVWAESSSPWGVFVTDTGVFVSRYYLETSITTKVQSEVLSVLANMSMDGIISGLQPTESIPPPDIEESISEFAGDRIEAFELVEEDNELILRASLREDADSGELLEDIRMFGGIYYPKPERLELVSDPSELEDGIVTNPSKVRTRIGVKPVDKDVDEEGVYQIAYQMSEINVDGAKRQVESIREDSELSVWIEDNDLHVEFGNEPGVVVRENGVYVDSSIDGDRAEQIAYEIITRLNQMGFVDGWRERWRN